VSDDRTTRAASYAAGALTPAERREVEQDARRDPRLAAEIDEFAETAALLGLAAAPVAPSDALRASILDAVEATPQESNVVRGPWFARPVAVMLGVAAALVIAVGGTTAVLTLNQEPSVVEQITAAADYERVVGDVEGGGSVTAVWSASLDRVALIADGLDELSADRIYQAWIIDEAGHAEPAGLFSGGATRSLELEAAMDAGDAIGVTVEPSGGSPAPTTTPIVVLATA
jgi:anti-sigma-K factor RskA